METLTVWRTPFGSASAMSLFDGCCSDEPFVYSFTSSGKVSRLSASPRSYSSHFCIAEDPSAVSSLDVTRQSVVVDIENTQNLHNGSIGNFEADVLMFELLLSLDPNIGICHNKETIVVEVPRSLSLIHI